jgi:hypothetical protein
MTVVREHHEPNEENNFFSGFIGEPTVPATCAETPMPTPTPTPTASNRAAAGDGRHGGGRS